MKKRNGFTLLEVILTLALISIVILGGTNLITFAIRGNRLTTNEYDIQSNIRIASQRMNNVVRDSSAVFILHRENANNLTDEWNYIMLNPEKDRLISYIWNKEKKEHQVKDLFPFIDGVTLDLELIKGNKVEDDIIDVGRLLRYNLVIEGAGETRTITTELESKNSLQVIDRSYLNKGNTLAYRSDTRLDEVSNTQAVVGMVLDTSGSMSDRMDGNSSVNDESTNSFYHSRMKLMKGEAIRLSEGLAKYPNVYISINPFDSTANASKDMMNAKQELDTSPGVRSIITGLTAGGGTNTGDGIRRAYYRIKDFNELVNDYTNNTTKTNKNFMIILVDGVTTFSSIHKATVEDTERSRTYYNDKIYPYNGKKYTWFNTTGGFFSRKWHHYQYLNPIEYVTGKGNITNSNASTGTNYASGAYYGFGNLLDPYGKEYVDIIGDMVKNYKEGTNEEIKVYVIGFSADSNDYGSLEDIALATTGDNVYYEAGSAEALEAIFKAIQRDISDSLWHIGGPN